MNIFIRKSPGILILMGTALLLMGAADAQIKSNGTCSLTTGVTGTRARSGASGNTSASAPVPLSAYAEELAKILNFDRNVIVLVKQVTNEHIHRLIGFDEDGYQIIAPGISVTVPEDRTDSMLESLRRKLLPLHYMAFVVEMNAGLKTDKIGILKTSDQYDILRIMHTDGDEYDITNQDVIDRLKEWQKISSFDIVGADSDWVEIEFRVLPKDLKAFAEEVYAFCPDAVDQGPGSVDGLITDMKKTNRLFLWWD
ncbi:MAG TPA: DUF4253 domain-containing protein [Nitrospirota bacterium]